MRHELKPIIDELILIAKENVDRAYRILGARPGPGLDLLIRPNEPIDGNWYVDGLTDAGRAFVKKFWFEQPLSNQKVAEMRKQALDWELTFETKLTIVLLED